MVYILDPKECNGSCFLLDEWHMSLRGWTEFLRANKPIPASYFPDSLTVVDADRELPDMFHTTRGLIVFSERARALMEERTPGQVEFIPVTFRAVPKLEDRLNLASAYYFINVLGRAQRLLWLEVPLQQFPTREDGTEAAPPVGSGRAISATTSGFPGRISLDAELMFSLCSLMSSRWKHDKPMSRTSFDRRFPDEAACARHLAELRWPDGFVCPACGVCKAWELATKPFTWECSGCHRQTSVTAGTVMHRSKLSLRTWFEAIHLLTCHSNGISAEQAQAQLGLGSYKTAWLLLHKLRRAMVNPERTLLQALVEVDEAEVPLRSKHDPIAHHGIPNVGKMLMIGAVELTQENHPLRIRLEPLDDRTGRRVRGFVERVVEPGATVISDGFAGYRKLSEHRTHVGKTVGNMAAHVLLPWIHRVFANLKRWLMGTFHGARKPHLRRYLDEFAFRWNRRRSTASAFDRLLGFAARMDHASMRDFIDQRV